jgi:serine/threonine protein kinase
MNLGQVPQEEGDGLAGFFEESLDPKGTFGQFRARVDRLGKKEDVWSITRMGQKQGGSSRGWQGVLSDATPVFCLTKRWTSKIERVADFFRRLAASESVPRLYGVHRYELQKKTGETVEKCMLVFEHFESDLFSRRDVWSSRTIARSAATALRDLHLQGIVHRDIKSENMVVARDPLRVKIIDLETAFSRRGEMAEEDPRLTFIGSHFYIAPEVAALELLPREARESEKAAAVARIGLGVDIWSLGCMFLGLWTKATPVFQRPKKGQKTECVQLMAEDGSQQRVDGAVESTVLPDTAKKLLRQMLVVDPARRCAIDDVVRLVSDSAFAITRSQRK